MNAFTAMLMGVIPLTLFAWTGSHIRSGIDEQRASEHWLLYLLGIIFALLGAILITTLFFDNGASAAYFIILPSMWGSLTAIFLFLFSKDRVWPSAARMRTVAGKYKNIPGYVN